MANTSENIPVGGQFIAPAIEDDTVADDTTNHTSSQEASTDPTAEDITAFVETAQKLGKELDSIVVGQERVVRELLLALLSGGHVLLEGVPGLGKTLLVRTLSDALALKF